MKKSTINPLPDFFDRYINLVPQDDLFEAFHHSVLALENLDLDLLENIGNKKYQADKWSTKDIFQHIIDNERVQAYRALRFARQDSTALPGYEENEFAKNAHANKRPISELLDELKTLRKSSIQLFQSFDESDMKQLGMCFNREISVLALGFVIIGHQIHHFNTIKEKYIPLRNNL